MHSTSKVNAAVVRNVLKFWSSQQRTASPIPPSTSSNVGFLESWNPKQKETSKVIEEFGEWETLGNINAELPSFLTEALKRVCCRCPSMIFDSDAPNNNNGQEDGLPPLLRATLRKLLCGVDVLWSKVDPGWAFSNSRIHKSEIDGRRTVLPPLELSFSARGQNVHDSDAAIAFALVLHAASQPVLAANVGPLAVCLCASPSRVHAIAQMVESAGAADCHVVCHAAADSYGSDGVPAIPPNKRSDIVVATVAAFTAYLKAGFYTLARVSLLIVDDVDLHCYCNENPDESSMNLFKNNAKLSALFPVNHLSGSKLMHLLNDSGWQDSCLKVATLAAAETKEIKQWMNGTEVKNKQLLNCLRKLFDQAVMPHVLSPMSQGILALKEDVSNFPEKNDPGQTLNQNGNLSVTATKKRCRTEEDNDIAVFESPKFDHRMVIIWNLPFPPNDRLVPPRQIHAEIYTAAQRCTNGSVTMQCRWLALHAPLAQCEDTNVKGKQLVPLPRRCSSLLPFASYGVFSLVLLFDDVLDSSNQVAEKVARFIHGRVFAGRTLFSAVVEDCPVVCFQDSQGTEYCLPAAGPTSINRVLSSLSTVVCFRNVVANAAGLQRPVVEDEAEEIISSCTFFSVTVNGGKYSMTTTNTKMFVAEEFGKSDTCSATDSAWENNRFSLCLGMLEEAAEFGAVNGAAVWVDDRIQGPADCLTDVETDPYLLEETDQRRCAGLHHCDGLIWIDLARVFVVFDTHCAAARCVETLNGQTFDGRRVLASLFATSDWEKSRIQAQHSDTRLDPTDLLPL